VVERRQREVLARVLQGRLGCRGRREGDLVDGVGPRVGGLDVREELVH
jgi:hypothetical protein